MTAAQQPKTATRLARIQRELRKADEIIRSQRVVAAHLARRKARRQARQKGNL